MAFEDMGTVVNQNQEHELDWDSTITAEGGSKPYVILPEGDYRFLIAGFEKKRYNPKPGSKIPACWNAQLKVLVYEKPEDEEPVVEIPHNLYLHSTQEWAGFFLPGHRPEEARGTAADELAGRARLHRDVPCETPDLQRQGIQRHQVFHRSQRYQKACTGSARSCHLPGRHVLNGHGSQAVPERSRTGSGKRVEKRA